MTNLFGLHTAELEALASSAGEPEYRGRQLARWLFRRGEADLSAMSDLPKNFREKLAAREDLVCGKLRILSRQVASDGTRKYLFGSRGGGTLEAVLMPYWDAGPTDEYSRSVGEIVEDLDRLDLAPEGGGSHGGPDQAVDLASGGSTMGSAVAAIAGMADSTTPPSRVTVCISTQVGCAVGCVFCATGLSGFQKNVSAGEMVEQVARMQRDTGFRVSNVVFMGMGEPFLNYDETLRAVRLLNREMGIGMRHLTLSTSGVVPGILRLASEKLQLTLAVSLHAPNDDLRDYLVPINRRYPLADLKGAMRRYVEETGRRLTIEYVMLRDVNDAPDLARELAHYLQDLPLVHVNLIPYNATDAGFQASTARAIGRFRTILRDQGVNATVRVERGAEIEGACGQLRRRLEGGAALARDVLARGLDG